MYSLTPLLTFPVRLQNMPFTKLLGQPLLPPAVAVCPWPPASLSGSSERHRPTDRAAPPLPMVDAELRVILEALAGDEAGTWPETVRCQFTQQM